MEIVSEATKSIKMPSAKHKIMQVKPYSLDGSAIPRISLTTLKRRQYFVRFTKFAFLFICVTSFASHVYEIFLQVFAQETTTSISYERPDKLELPNLTLCPKVPYKQVEEFTSEEVFVKNSFSLEENFYNTTLNDIKDGKWIVKETRAGFFGICFTFEYHKAVGAIDLSTQIHIRPNRSFIVHFHEAGEEFWMPYYIVPVPLPRQMLDNDLGTIGAADLKTRKHVYSLLKRDDNCKYYKGQGTEFAKCAKDILANKVYDIVPCYTPLLKTLNIGENLPKCTNVTMVEAHMNSLWDYLSTFGSSPAEAGCPLPCKRAEFDIEITPFHKTSQTHDTNLYTVLYVYYGTMTVESRKEILLYDASKFLSAVGGSLGLFLGFSCLGVLNRLVRTMEDKIAM